MMKPLSLSQQIEANFRKVEASPAFSGERLWLTFYLSGPPEDLQRLATALDGDGWLNTQGAEGAFLYPKVAVRKVAEEVVRTAQSTENLCQKHQIGIILIDADTSPKVEDERPFVTLYRNPQPLGFHPM